MIIKIPINKLRYDFDPEIGRNWPDFIQAFSILEKSLPDIPGYLTTFVHKYYIDLLKVYNSIDKEGLKEPLIVLQVGDLYRVRIGNQRLLSIRSQKKLKVVPCIIKENI